MKKYRVHFDGHAYKIQSRNMFLFWKDVTNCKDKRHAIVTLLVTEQVSKEIDKILRDKLNDIY
jgi:hypothetical protein